MSGVNLSIKIDKYSIVCLQVEVTGGGQNDTSRDKDRIGSYLEHVIRHKPLIGSPKANIMPMASRLVAFRCRQLIRLDVSVQGRGRPPLEVEILRLPRFQ